MLGAEQRRSLSSTRRNPRDSQKLTTRIRAQLEYYWSDANVSRDRFFSERLSRDADCWVTVGELRGFPILKKLRATETDILAAASSSEFLVVDAFSRIDRNWRQFPPRLAIDNLANLQTDADRTVYIENIPLSVDREEIIKVLGLAGVQHVSLPRHARTGERQGFCFAELTTADQARDCVRRLQRSWPVNWEPRKDGKRLRLLAYKRWAALRDESKASRARAAKYSYCVDLARVLGEADSSGASSSSDSAASESEAEADDSYPETSLAERRRTSPGAIRQNSLIRISGIPQCTTTQLRVWLGHFAVSLQYLDFADGDDTAVIRVANRKARDFLLRDYSISKLPILNTLPSADALTQEEFDTYFEDLREKRRESIRSNQPVNTPKAGISSTGKQTLLHVRKGWEKKGKLLQGGSAWTDVVAGNGNWAAAGTSNVYRIPFNRQEVARLVGAESPRSSYCSSPRRESFDDFSPR